MVERDLPSRGVDLELVLLAPSTASVAGLDAVPTVNPRRHDALLSQVVRLRADSDLDDHAAHSGGHDRASWHILAIRSESGDVAGGVRLRIHNLRYELPSAAECFDYAGVRIADAAAATQLSQALGEHIGAQRLRSWGFYQVGGFVVAPNCRSTGVGLFLAVTTSVLVARLGLRGGCIFATTTNKVDSLLCMVGAYPLRVDGREIAPFYCERHRASGVLLGSEAGRLDPQLLPMQAPIAERLLTATVLVPA